ncbi:MAG: aminoglycoside 3'-phosphotransferase/choline kinase family protein [Planctomycetota bacterium]
MARVLPPITNDDQLDEVHADAELCTRAIAAFATREGLEGSVTFFEEGSAIVGRVGDGIVKMFAPYDTEHADTEARVLRHLEGRLPCPTPAVLGRATFDDWSVVSMSALDGVPLSRVWSDLSETEKEELCKSMGATTRALHDLPVEPVADLPPDWKTFIQAGPERCLERQRRFKLPPHWIEQIEPYLASVELPETQPVLLHTELMREHFLVAERNGTWALTGLIDFEPSMVGHPEYDFSSVGLFITDANPRLIAAFARGYDLQPDADLPRRCLAYTLLHRYACLPWYLERLPSDGLTTLDQLAESWWPFPPPSRA